MSDALETGAGSRFAWKDWLLTPWTITLAAPVLVAVLDPGRIGEVLSIAFAGPVTAFACVQCSIAPRHFTDFLTLVQVEGRWQIVSKVFHFDA